MAKQKFNTVPAKLVAAFDAAGKEDSGLVVVAGFISSQEDWRSFDVQWRARLKQDGLDYFHMVDFAMSKKQFATGWKENEARRQALFSDLLEIIKSHAYRQFASAIEMRSFDTLSEENREKYSLNAYVLAARSCAADVRLWQAQEKFMPPTAYVFEEGDEGKGKMIERFLGDNISLPLFKLKKDSVRPDGTPSNAYTPLQAADILAYELHKRHRDLLAGKPPLSKFRWGLEQLTLIPGVPGYYSPQNMAELNAKFEGLKTESESVDDMDPSLAGKPENSI